MVVGGTGQIGRALCASLIQDGSEVVVFSRNAAGAKAIVPGAAAYTSWDPETISEECAEQLSRAEAVVYLAGGSLFDGRRYTKLGIEHESQARVQATSVLVSALGRLDTRPTTLIAASSVGYYGYARRRDNPSTRQARRVPTGGDDPAKRLKRLRSPHETMASGRSLSERATCSRPRASHRRLHSSPAFRRLDWHWAPLDPLDSHQRRGGHHHPCSQSKRDRRSSRCCSSRCPNGTRVFAEPRATARPPCLDASPNLVCPDGAWEGHRHLGQGPTHCPRPSNGIRISLRLSEFGRGTLRPSGTGTHYSGDSVDDGSKYPRATVRSSTPDISLLGSQFHRLLASPGSILTGDGHQPVVTIQVSIREPALTASSPAFYRALDGPSGADRSGGCSYHDGPRPRCSGLANLAWSSGLGSGATPSRPSSDRWRSLAQRSTESVRQLRA